MDENHDGIDDRWLDKAAEFRRQIVSHEQSVDQLTRQLATTKERLAAFRIELSRVKAAIATKAAFVEPPKK